jgi:hypothetical protein
MDIVYIYRHSRDDGRELRYSLRSLSNVPHGKVFIIGDKPKWTKGIVHVPASDPHGLKALNALHKITVACRDPRVSEDFVLMNDDFYVLKPIPGIPTLHRGTIS